MPTDTKEPQTIKGVRFCRIMLQESGLNRAVGAGHDTGVRRFLARQANFGPRPDEIDLIDVDFEESFIPEADVIAYTAWAMGHRHLADWLLEHRTCSGGQFTWSGPELHAICNGCKSQPLILSIKSLVGVKNSGHYGT